jgi:hypothetical protein
MLLKNSATPPILGGAALQRCDKWAVLNSGFSRRAYFWRAIRVFQQPASDQCTTVFRKAQSCSSAKLLRLASHPKSLLIISRQPPKWYKRLFTKACRKRLE